MKKYLSYILIALYIASLFLPFAYTMSVDSYQLEAFSGWTFLIWHPLTVGASVIIILLLLFGKNLSLAWKIRLETVLILISAYLYTIPFQNYNVTTMTMTDMFNRTLTILKTGLASGYYVSLVLLICLIVTLSLSKSK